ncbi:phosphonate C-P lyase system protein PhnH [Roseovarius ramblicola]|uniref:Phosphonate C-P lyase system protein PhnH n=1 Tax=Roseovarius ramblicola TaxID=2022336 RepID=A0ABV5I455_9RHOB
METAALGGGFNEASVDAARAFRAVMRAMARPGTIERVAGAAPPAPLSVAAGVAVLVLCDPGTLVYLAGGHDTRGLRDWIGFHTGAPVVAERGAAMFALGVWEALAPLDGYALGEAEFPDRSATLIVEVERLEPYGARLTGPGIKGASALSLPEVAAFQANAARFPLGLDFLLCCGNRLAGLPRSSHVEAG